MDGERFFPRKPTPGGQETDMPRKHDAHRDELEGVAERLRSERPQASPLDLDRIKTTAMARAKAESRGGRVGARRFAVAGLTVGLMAAGTGGVIASSGSGSTHSNAAVAQYGSSCDTNNGNGNNIGSGNGNKDGNGNGNTAFAAYYGRSGKDNKGSKGSSGGTGNGSGNNTENGNGNGVGNGNENGNESGNGNNNFNCNENSFNETTIVEENNSTNTTTNNVTNNYYATTVTVSASPTTAAGGVQGSTTTKKATTSTRNLNIHIKVGKSKLRKVTLKVDGKVVSVLKGKKASANIKLTKLPCTSAGTTTVTITAVTAGGKKITETHTYHLCQA
jgi:hypothetical protein